MCIRLRLCLCLCLCWPLSDRAAYFGFISTSAAFLRNDALVSGIDSEELHLQFIEQLWLPPPPLPKTNPLNCYPIYTYIIHYTLYIYIYFFSISIEIYVLCVSSKWIWMFVAEQSKNKKKKKKKWRSKICEELLLCINNLLNIWKRRWYNGKLGTRGQLGKIEWITTIKLVE